MSVTFIPTPSILLKQARRHSSKGDAKAGKAQQLKTHSTPAVYNYHTRTTAAGT